MWSRIDAVLDSREDRLNRFDTLGGGEQCDRRATTKRRIGPVQPAVGEARQTEYLMCVFADFTNSLRERSGRRRSWRRDVGHMQSVARWRAGR